MAAKRSIKVAVPQTGEEEVSAVRDVILSGNFISGRYVSEFEKAFASYIGVREASAVNSGTAALHVALAALGIGPGDEVIVPALTFMSTATAVLHQNAIPVFADIDKDSFCMSPEDMEKRITERTRAIIPVHLYGNAADMDRIMEIARVHDLYVVEDCAQAHGTQYRGRKVGSIGDMGAFSFFATKHMTTGEGGIITSDNKGWIRRANQIRSHGMAGRDDHVVLGYNYRMNEIAASMGLVQLKKLDGFNEKRIKNSMKILSALDERNATWYQVPKMKDHILHTFFWCPLRIRKDAGLSMDEVVGRLNEKGVEVRQRYKAPLYRQKVIAEYSPYPGRCPFRCQNEDEIPDYNRLYLRNAEHLSGRIIGLPNHPGLSEDDVDYVIDTVSGLF